MDRGTWAVTYWTGSTWASDGTIYRPNENVSVDLRSTQQKVNMADGSYGFFTPETKYTNEDMVFQFLEILESDTFRSKLENYIKNATYLKITTHLGEDLIGKFISCKRVWLKGVEDTYDIEVAFQRMV